MTPDEFKIKMEEAMRESDAEDRHIMGDRLMITLLHELGYGEGVELFDQETKWYG